MNKPTTLLDRVRSRLSGRRGAELNKIEADTGISYDTLLRIRDDKVDPSFGKVQRLAEYFRLVRAAEPAGQQDEPAAA